MNNLEKQLNKLPRARLGKVADLKIRLRLYYFIISEKLALMKKAFVIRRTSFSYAVVAIIILSLVVVVPGYAYASPDVIPGHVLYPVKRGLENIELNLPSAPENKAETYVKMADRRLAEAKAISETEEDEIKPSVLAQTINEAVEMNYKAKEEIALVKESKKAKEVKSKVSEAQEEQVETLITIAQTVGVEAEESVLDSVALALESISASSDQTEEYPEDAISEDVEKDEVGEEAKKIKDDNRKVEQKAKKKKTRDIKSWIKKWTTPSSKDIDEEIEPEDFPATDAPENEEVKEDKKEDVKQSLDNLEQDIIQLKEDLPNNKFRNDDIKKLFERLDIKFEKAQDAYEQNDHDKFNEIEQSTEALTNNGKYFLRFKDWQDMKKNNRGNFNNNEDDKDNDDDYDDNNSKKIPPGQLKKQKKNK